MHPKTKAEGICALVCLGDKFCPFSIRTNYHEKKLGMCYYSWLCWPWANLRIQQNIYLASPSRAFLIYMSTYSSHLNISSGVKVPHVVLAARSLQLWYLLKAALSTFSRTCSEKQHLLSITLIYCMLYVMLFTPQYNLMM